MSKSSGTRAEPGAPELGHLVDAVDPEGPGLTSVPVEPHQVPVALPEPEPGHVDLPGPAPVAERNHRALADGVEQRGQRGQAPEGGEVHERDRGVPERRLASRSQFQEGLPADRLTQVNAGHGQVQGGLLLCLESEVGKVVGGGVDAVPQLVLPSDGHHQHGHALVAEEPLVPFEGLAAGHVVVGVAGHPVGDVAQAQRARGVEQHQQQVGDPLEPIETLHRGQSRAGRAGG